VTRHVTVRTVPRFDRLLRHLTRRHPELGAMYAKALEILEVDPRNVTQTHPIRKLEGVARDEGGQYRLRLGRFRFRYDIEGHTVVLYYSGLRREDTYR
jgi:mRNA-degrading endonuclease RelE of RelBE toxin-antitoxin system